MRTLSQGFIEALNDDEREYLAYADITLSSGTELHLTNSEIWSGGFSYEEAVSGDESFTALGSTIIGSATLIINNIYEDFSEYVFDNAEVILSLGMEINNEVEKFTIGTYMVDSATYNGATIQLKLLDYMAQFDRPYSLSNLTYPATLEQIFTDVCLTCGLQPESFSFPRRTFSIPTRPVDEALTCRDILSWVATIAGCFAKITPTGRVELKWFDYEHLDDVDIEDPYFHPWNTGEIYNEYGVHYLYNLRSQNVAVDDIVISGVVANVRTESEEASESIISYKIGADGFVITIDNNSFLSTENGQTVVNTLGPELIGTRFRKLNITQDSDPSIQAGDVAIVRDRKGNLYKTLITRITFSVGSSQTIVCGAETPAKNSATQYSSPTKAYVESRKLFTESMTAAESALESAIEAGIAAREAQQSADEAQASATSAYNSAVSANTHANSALTQLSVVEDVAGTLRWISEHGSFVATTDTTVNPNTVYFELIDGDYVPIAEPDPTINPSEAGWYILDVTDSQASFIMAHLAVTSAGLWILPVNGLASHSLTDSNGDQLVDSDGNPIIDFSQDPQNASGYKLLLSPTGMIIYDEAGNQVSFYGESIEFSSTRPQYIGGENAYIIYYDANNDGIPETIRVGGDIHLGTNKTLTEALYEIDNTQTLSNNNSDSLKKIQANFDAFKDEITLSVSSLANNTQIFKGEAIEDYQSDEIPTLLNYPTFTDFFIWDNCANNIYCADNFICGTNNYIAHINEIVLNTVYNDYYQFREYAGVYSWIQLTTTEIEALANNFSYVRVDENGVMIKSYKNNQFGQLQVTPDGVIPSIIYCC